MTCPICLTQSLFLKMKWSISDVQRNIRPLRAEDRTAGIQKLYLFIERSGTHSNALDV